MAQPNVYQVSDWNGSSGERWVTHRQRLDAMLAHFGDAAIAAADARPGERVLDVGCGAGTSSIALARNVGATGEVLGLDISGPLIALAQSQQPTDLPVRYALADAGSATLTTHGFNLLFSRFGVMFFDDPVASFAHMRRWLRPGGRIAFVCWRAAADNDWVRLPMGAIRDIVPPLAPPDPEAPGPFSFGDPARVTRILSDAGFAEIDLTALDGVIPFGQGANREAALDDALAMAFEVGPLSRALADQLADVRDRAAQAVRSAFAARPGETAILIDGAAWIVTATNPG